MDQTSKLTASIASRQAATEAAAYEYALNVGGGTKPGNPRSRGQRVKFRERAASLLFLATRGIARPPPEPVRI
ncbi:hypothetical protein TgHK011_002265 [Trichoderma gracile]|nr:hypothetical protein TgHK011_002265 [Trichoderma gracile]